MDKKKKKDEHTITLNPQIAKGDIYVNFDLSRSTFVDPGATTFDNSSEEQNARTVHEADVKQKLKEWYGNLQVPVVSWMKGSNLPLENYFIPLPLNSTHRICQEPNTESRRSRSNIDILWRHLLNVSARKLTEDINLEDIFNAVDGVKPKRILIESQPGFGKTTLAHKIMSDWVAGKNYVCDFEFAVLISLRYLRGRTIREVVLDVIDLKIDNEQLWNIINSNKTLLVLDGLDEVGESQREHILKTLYDVFSNKMVIVTTCRTGLFTLNDEEKGVLFGGAAKNEEFWDEKITILGLTGKSRKSFVERFVEEENRDQIMKEIKELIQPVKEMFQSPLLLILLVFVTRDILRYKIKTKTDLFKNLVDCVVRRNVNDKQIRKLGKNFTLFGHTNEQYHTLFCKFGEISIDRILNNDLQFECDDFTDLIYQMGFFIKHETKLKLETITHYEIFHLTMLEFAAAFFLNEQFKKNGCKFLPDQLEKINILRLQKGSTSMVLPFLCGLMGKDVFKLFNELSEFCAMFSIEQIIMDSLLCECELSNEFYSTVAQFIPPIYSYNNLQPLVTTNEDLCKNIISLIVSSDELWFLAQKKPVNMQSIAVFVSGTIPTNDIERCSYKNTVKCSKLFVYMNHSVDSYANMAVQLKLLLHCVDTDYKNVYIGQDVHLNLIQKCINKGIFKNQNVDYFRFELTNEQIARETIVNLIENNFVTQFTLEIEKNCDINSLGNVISIALSSPHITSMLLRNFTGKTLQLDLNTISQNGTKYWQYFGVTNVKITNSVPSSKQDCVNSLQTYVDADAVSLLKLSQLHCTCNLFRSNLSSWVGLESILNLTLCLGGQNIPLESLSCLGGFRNLETVKFLIIGVLDNEQESEIFKCLDLLSVNHLQIRWLRSIYFVGLRVINGITDSLKNNKLKSIEHIDLELVDDDESLRISNYLYILSSLVPVLECDSKVTAYLVYQFNKLNDKSLLLVFSAFSSTSFCIQQITRNVISPYTTHDYTCDFYLPLLRILKIRKKIL